MTGNLVVCSNVAHSLLIAGSSLPFKGFVCACGWVWCVWQPGVNFWCPSSGVIHPGVEDRVSQWSETWVRLASEWAPGTCLFPPPQCWFTSLATGLALLTWALGLEVRSMSLYRLTYPPNEKMLVIKVRFILFVMLLSTRNIVSYTRLAKYNCSLRK